MDKINSNTKILITNQQIKKIITNGKFPSQGVLNNFIYKLKIFVSDVFYKTNIRQIISCSKNLSKQFNVKDQGTITNKNTNLKKFYDTINNVLALRKEINSHDMLSSEAKISLSIEKKHDTDEIIMHFCINNEEITSLKCNVSQESLIENLDIEGDVDDYTYVSSMKKFKELLHRWKEEKLLDQSDIQILENSFEPIDKLYALHQSKHQIGVETGLDLNFNYQDTESSIKIDNRSILKQLSCLAKKPNDDIKKFIDLLNNNLHSILLRDGREESHIISVLSKLHYLAQINKIFDNTRVKDVFLDKITSILVDSNFKTILHTEVVNSLKKNKIPTFTFEQFYIASKSNFIALAKQDIKKGFIKSDKKILESKIIKKANSLEFKYKAHQIWSDLVTGQHYRKRADTHFATLSEKTDMQKLKKARVKKANIKFNANYPDINGKKSKKSIKFNNSVVIQGEPNKKPTKTRLKGENKNQSDLKKIPKNILHERTSSRIVLTIHRSLNEFLGIEN